MSNPAQRSAQTVVELAEHMVRLQDAATAFQQSTTARQRGYFSPSEDDQVVQLWVSYHMARNALLETISGYQQTTTTNIALADFAVAYAAAVVLVDAGRFLRELFAGEPVIRRKLNELYELYGITAGSFDAIQMSLSDPGHAVQLYQANQFFEQHATALRQSAASDDTLAAVLAIIDRLSQRLNISVTDYAKARVHERARDLYEKLVDRGTRQAVYAIQSWVSRWVGQLSTQPTHQPALPENIKTELLALLQPGDVLVTRKEHSLTNYFLPGYWPHAALYLGGSRVVEALADGVHERSVESPFAVDAITAIRPQLEAEQIETALERARRHVGKPYDFDFDFTRADRMVCTEVVYRSYAGIGTMQFQLTRRTGRETLSAEDLLNLARRQDLFQTVAVFCPLHSQELLSSKQAEAVLQATVKT